MDEQAKEGAAEERLTSHTPAQTRDQVARGIAAAVVVTRAICDALQSPVNSGSVVMNEQAKEDAVEERLTSHTPAKTRNRVLWGIIVVSLVVIQASCDKLQLTVSPGSVLQSIAYAFVQSFRWLGDRLAAMSALLDYIDLRWIIDIVRDVGWALFKAFVDLTLPLAQLILSPWYAINGYLAYTITYAHPGVLLVGTMILACAALSVAIYFGATRRVRSFIDSHLSFSLILLVSAVVLGCSLYFNAFDKLGAMKVFRRMVYG